MDTPSMETIYQAISALYENSNANDKEIKEKASKWLGEVQKSIHSWKIADELLQQKKDIHSCYFAAQTMRSKVQHNLSELPEEARASLRDSLIAHLRGDMSETSQAILTQLCLALADLALQMPTWKNCTSDLIKSFSDRSNPALLEILTVLPQEIDSSSLKLGENRREDIRLELRTNTDLVTLFLKESITSTQNTQLALKIIKCMTSWIHVRAVNIQEIPQNAVIAYCLQVLRDYNCINTLHDAASDCLCSLLHCLEENNNNEEIERLLFESVGSLEECYHLAVAHEEEDKASNFARIFTELAETFLEKIISATATGQTHFAMRSLELALVCVGHHDYEVAEITFNLWYRLSEVVYRRDYQPLTDAFKPHIERLIEALARHCQCEPDRTQLLDEGDDFYEFRVKVMELIKDVVFIVGSSSVFRQMFATLQADLSWERTEAALFVMQAVAKNILPDEYEYVPKVVEAILSMPEGAHPAVRKTCILLLGELCDWIERHPTCLEPCLQTLVTALQEPKLAPAAATALQNICKACSKEAASHAVTLLRATRHLDSLALPPGAGASLVRALASALASLPQDQLTVAMREAASIQLSALKEILSGSGGDTDPCPTLDLLAALFRELSPRKADACVPALGDAWPVLHDVLIKYQSDGRVMERGCRALRFALRCCARRAAPLLPHLARAMADIYAQHQHSCLLYLASILVDELAHEPECVSDLIDLLKALMPRAFELLQQENGLKDNPDTVDDLFRLCIRFLQRIPLEFLSSGAMPAVVQCGTLATALDHREANCSVMKFLLDLVSRATTTREQNKEIKVLADAILEQYGGELMYGLMQSAVLHLHSYMLGEVGEVVLELVRWQRARGAELLAPALARLPRGPVAATEHQCWNFHQLAIRAEKCKEMTRLLRDFARLYR
ncbi:transportin-3 [Leguminivora glycinivorella]|uniref:transportin-3 n=1 Tax=Leguminivora glycinivorella TaxID=1035111 RepID=UPI00200CF5F5|nr:transportin-3 [Leguminivora glycinivorella]